MTAKSLLSQLHAYRQQLDATCAERLPGWQRTEPELAGATSLEALFDRIRQRPDACLTALLRLGQAGDRAALEVIFHAMLGVAVRVGRGREDWLAEALTELWLAIVEYPLARRPRSIAANLAWAVRRSAAERASAELSLPELAVPPAEPDASAILVEARRCGLIDATTHRTLWIVYVAGLPSHRAAEVLGTSAKTVRWRCSRALRRLRAHAELLAA